MPLTPDGPSQKFFWPRIGMLPAATQGIWMILVVVIVAVLIAAIARGIVSTYNTNAQLTALDNVVSGGMHAIEILVGAFAGTLSRSTQPSSA